MSEESLIKTNLTQNHPDFKLKLLNEKPFFFKKKGYLEKILDPIQKDSEEARTCTIKCLGRGCS
jgi:hypothetical protein